jgi:perosamine synthetase
MIPISQPMLTQVESDYVSDALASGWVSSQGSYIKALENEFACYCGTSYALAVSNGTVGLHLALAAFGVGRGDEVIVPDLTFVATANAVATAGATPVMVDVCRSTYCIDPERIVEAITEKTKAIIPVHLYGHPAAMDQIMEIASEHKLIVIEDAAEAHGATFNQMKVGAMGDCGVFSLYGNKIITSGEGGLITTNNKDFYDRAVLLRDHAMSKEVRYWHTEVGYNYRMTNLQAALGVAQLRNIDKFLIYRNDVLRWYKDRLVPHGIECNPQIGATPVNWLVCAVIERLGRTERDALIAYLARNGIDSRPFFFPISMMPIFKSDVVSPVSHKLSECGLNLPTFVGITEQQVDMVCKVFLDGLSEISPIK